MKKDLETQIKKNFLRLIKIVKKLLGKNGCPWDKMQTHLTLLKHLDEEVMEFKNAVRKKDVKGMEEELGDIMLHIVFHSVLASKEKLFNINSVLTSLNKKLIRRHPHVFGNLKCRKPEEALKIWKKIKKEEKKQRKIKK